MWSCVVCTLRNQDYDQQCDACGTDRPASSANAAAAHASSSVSGSKRARAEGEPFTDDELELLDEPPPPAQRPRLQQQQPTPPTRRAASNGSSSMNTTAASAAATATATLPAAPRAAAPALPPASSVCSSSTSSSPPVRATSSQPPQQRFSVTDASVNSRAQSPSIVPSAGLPVARASSAVAASSAPPPAAAHLSRVPLALSRAGGSSSSSSSSAKGSSGSVSAAATVSAERAARADEKARERLAKSRAKDAAKADKGIDKLVARCHRGAFAEQEIHLFLHEEFKQQSRFAKLLSGLQENKLSFSFPTVANGAAAASASHAAASVCSSSSLAVLRALPRCVLWDRRQAPEVVAALRAHKRARALEGPPDAWRSMDNDAARAEQHEAADSARRKGAAGSSATQAAEPEIMEELPAPQPVNCVLVLMSGAEFLQLHSSAQLQPTITRWLDVLDRHEQKGKTILLLVHGLYALVQLEATQALQQRRDNAAAKQNGLPSSSPSPSTASKSSSVKPLKKLSDVDALLAALWFGSSARVRCKMMSDEEECVAWIVSLSTILSKAPYKDNSDSVLTLVNTGRTDRMRGGDDFRLRVADSDSDGDDDNGGGSSSAAVRSRRQAAKSTLAESWRLYLMQLPRMSERIALCIARAYPSLRQLWDAYRACATDKARETLVADVIVSGGPPAAGGAAAAATRAVRVGPALSKALFQSIWLNNAELQPNDVSASLVVGGAAAHAQTAANHADDDDMME